MKTNNKHIALKFADRQDNAKGFSAIELIIVLVIIGIMSAISLPYIYNYRRVYRSEEESLKIMDLMKEASQLALTRRRTYRFEIDMTANSALIIDENGAGPADDRLVKSIPLAATNEIRVNQAPTGVTAPSPPNYNTAVFANDTVGHQIGATRVTGNNVWVARFRSNATVVNNAGTPVSSTIFVWAPPQSGGNAARSLQEVRAVTIFGGTGAVRYWKYNGTTFMPY